MKTLIALFRGSVRSKQEFGADSQAADIENPYARKSPFLTHPVFNTHHTETEMLRYLTPLGVARSFALTTSMIPLGSCTMKLNATAEMFPISWPEFAKLHPFAPDDQPGATAKCATSLHGWLAEITGFAAVSLQPNAGSQGEYAGLLAIREYHASRGEGGPQHLSHSDLGARHEPGERGHGRLQSRSGGDCLKDGDIDLADLRAKADEHTRRSGRVDDHLSFARTAFSRQPSARFAKSFMRTAARFTWMART